jgi:hypothetical protein
MQHPASGWWVRVPDASKSLLRLLNIPTITCCAFVMQREATATQISTKGRSVTSVSAGPHVPNTEHHNIGLAEPDIPEEEPTLLEPCKD